MAVGAILFSVATVWTLIVYYTVPTGSGVGPRAFPLVLGIALMGLSATLVVANLRGWNRVAARSVPKRGDGGVPEPKSATSREGAWLQLRVLVTVCVTIALYGYLMQKLGFVVATFLTVVLTLVFTLGERRILVVSGMGFGLTLGCWLVFGKLLGAYIPRGTWISLF